MTNTFPTLPFYDLPLTTIIPSPADEELFIPYLTRLYEDIATVVNQKDNTYFTIPIGTTAAIIPNVPNSGAFIICIAGTMDGMPAVTYSLIKTNSTAAGTASQIQVQPGTTIGTNATWNNVNLLIGSTATNFTIVHNAIAGTIGNFNVRFIGTM